MFKNLFAKVGIGAAKVDAILDTDQFSPGGRVEGKIQMSGGKVEQRVDAITLKLMTTAKEEGEDMEVERSHAIAQYRVAEAFTLAPGEEKQLPFAFDLHPETPVTVLDLANNRCKVWLETALDIEMAMDPTDRDYLNIYPSPVMAHCIEAMENNGFKMVKADVEKGYLRGHGFESNSGCYQEIEFKPKGFGFSRIQEVELSFIPEQGQTHLLVEIDRAFSGDGYKSLTLSNKADYRGVESQIKNLL